MEIPRINDAEQKEQILRWLSLISKQGNDKNIKTNNNQKLENLFENSDLPITPFQLNKIRHLYIDRPEYIFYNKTLILFISKLVEFLKFYELFSIDFKLIFVFSSYLL
jgi:hypothetical protein